MLPVALTTATGYFLFSPSFSLALLKIVLGVLLLAIAASVLNQIQERIPDALMNRTLSRPLAQKSMSLRTVWIICLLSASIGSYLIFIGGGLIALALGLFTMLWYNGIYTPLKKITPFAVVPGALTGAIPPFIGFTGAGGYLLHPEILALGFVFFMAQIPHFWMIQIKYNNEYKNAGFPVLTSLISKNALESLTFIWVTASLASTMLLPLFQIVTHNVSIYSLFIISGIILLVFLNRLFNGVAMKDKVYFTLFNLYFLFVMTIIIVEKINITHLP
jgi:heme o synthase